jgi:hypothetical protein
MKYATRLSFAKGAEKPKGFSRQGESLREPEIQRNFQAAHYHKALFSPPVYARVKKTRFRRQVTGND